MVRRGEILSPVPAARLALEPRDWYTHFMNPHELILLSPYRFPGQNSLMVGNEDIGAFLNGYLTLWHPAVALGAAGPPRVGSPYDHEQPVAGQAYAVPDHT